MGKICTFFGHREIRLTDELIGKLKKRILDLIKNGFDIFYFGGFGDFDELCWKIVTYYKKQYSYIKRIYVCEDYKFIDRPHKRPNWLRDENYEEFIYLDISYTGFYKRIYFRNCEMINQSDYIIFYVTNNVSNSGAYKALEYAKRKKKNYVNILEK